MPKVKRQKQTNKKQQQNWSMAKLEIQTTVLKIDVQTVRK